MRKVVVIGAGAAGMMAAISAAEHGAHTVVLEHKDRVGKKILSTGNGRCNFTNLVQTPQCYRSDDPKFPWRVITQFDEKKTVEFFQNIGVYAKNRNGYLYPNSDQAGAVLVFPSHGDGAALCGSAHRDRSSGNHSEKEPVCHPNRKWECDRRPGDPGSRIQGGSCYRF